MTKLQKYIKALETLNNISMISHVSDTNNTNVSPTGVSNEHRSSIHRKIISLKYPSSYQEFAYIHDNFANRNGRAELDSCTYIEKIEKNEKNTSYVLVCRHNLCLEYTKDHKLIVYTHSRKGMRRLRLHLPFHIGIYAWTDHRLVLVYYGLSCVLGSKQLNRMDHRLVFDLQNPMTFLRDVVRDYLNTHKE